MPAPLYTVDQEFSAETEEKKSRFLAFLVPYTYFDERLSALQQEFRKANHHVTAFRYLDADDRVVEGCKDDGEPGGTAGMPMLKVMQGRGLINCAVIVVRFFGRTKLGTGGLARAYADSAGAVIDSATIVPWRKMAAGYLSVGFADSARVEQAIADEPVTVTDRGFSENGVTLSLSGEEDAIKRLQHQFGEPES